MWGFAETSSMVAVGLPLPTLADMFAIISRAGRATI